MASSISTSTIVDSNPRRAGRILAQGYPKDYNVFESDVAAISASSKRTTTTAPTETRNCRNPPGWPNDYRRIPPHRTTNRNLDQSQRRVYTSFGERAFLTMMFTGLEVNVIANRVWKYTGGQVTQNIFTYKVGGEF